jgi:glutamine cyclotransferase
VCQPNAAGTGLDIVRTISVKTSTGTASFNEIEMVQGKYILANNYQYNDIYKFRVSDGKLVKQWYIPQLL